MVLAHVLLELSVMHPIMELGPLDPTEEANLIEGKGTNQLTANHQAFDSGTDRTITNSFKAPFFGHQDSANQEDVKF